MSEHGTISRYNSGCRCDECRRANREYGREYYRKRKQADREADLAKRRACREMYPCRSPHGTRSRYNSGCRCDECRRANREYERRRTMTRIAVECGAPSPMVDAEPVRRRILDLLAAGYSRREICRISGLARTTLHSITTAHHRSGKPVKMVRRETKDAIFAIRGRRSLSGHQVVSARWMADQVARYLSLGMSVAGLSRVTGIDRQVLDGLVHGRRRGVNASTLHAFVRAKPALDSMLADHERRDGWEV